MANTIFKHRSITNQNYEDELRSLQLGQTKEALQNMFRTRFIDLETVDLDALLIDKYGS